jgi:hypothetical protein
MELLEEDIVPLNHPNQIEECLRTLDEQLFWGRGLRKFVGVVFTFVGGFPLVKSTLKVRVAPVLDTGQ